MSVRWRSTSLALLALVLVLLGCADTVRAQCPRRSAQVSNGFCACNVNTTCVSTTACGAFLNQTSVGFALGADATCAGTFVFSKCVQR